MVAEQTGFAQRKTDLKKLEEQVESLQKGQAEMQKELKELKEIKSPRQALQSPLRQRVRKLL